MTAVFSPCRNYRYRLTRGAPSSGRTVVFIGVNPSTADEANDDQTIRKMCGFARSWSRFDRVVVVNLFAWRSTNVSALAHVPDPVGIPQNDQYIREAAGGASLVVPCWGRLDKLPLRLRFRALEVREILRASSTPDLQCLGFTKGGDPLHPLMLSYAAPLVKWP